MKSGIPPATRSDPASQGRTRLRPARFGKRGRAADIRFATGRCTLGAVLAAATDAGICAILLGDTPEELLTDLRDRFPQAAITPAGPSFRQSLCEIVRSIDSPGLPLRLPIDLHGTPFQLAVWNALQSVPPGTTTTYSGIAAALGRPTAIRAVARACAANPLAIAVPCHRVLRKSGDPAGYRWGLPRKLTLLQRESTHPPLPPQPAPRSPTTSPSPPLLRRREIP